VIYREAEPMDDMALEQLHPVPEGVTLEETTELLRLQRQANTSSQQAQQGATHGYGDRNNRLQYRVRTTEIQMRLRHAAGGNRGQNGNEQQGHVGP
jgi:hypothetical protein